MVGGVSIQFTFEVSFIIGFTILYFFILNLLIHFFVTVSPKISFSTNIRRSECFKHFIKQFSKIFEP